MIENPELFSIEEHEPVAFDDEYVEDLSAEDLDQKKKNFLYIAS